ncbi:MAG: hypothetical protein K6G73_06670 [Marinilabiliaceae bacterium]|nr:hypothetical protein [Marinilabiliaceae bacterium]
MRRKIFTKLAMIATMLSSLSLTAYATEDPVSYVYYTVDGTTATMHTDGSQTSYTVVTDQTTWSAGWYVVNSDVTIADRITVSGTVNLILCDGKTLTASKGITVNSENTLNIYAQSEGTGALTATGEYANAGVGGTSSDIIGGTVNIHGGAVTATGGNNAAGIGGGHTNGAQGNGGTVTIYSGTVNANGGESSAGIGGGIFGNGGTVTIYGGTVTATGGNYPASAGIGKGGNSNSSDGTLTLGTGVTMKVSSNNSTWTNYDGSTRARYMKTSVPEPQEPVSYVYYTVDGTTATMHTDGSQTSYTVVTDQTTWSAGWYVVNSDVTIADRITVSGTVNLILCDGKTQTASKGITVNSENTLNIYAQSEGTGALTATGAEWDGDNAYAGIGGTTSNAGGTVIIHGGNVTAKGGMFGAGGAAGIGGGFQGAGGSVTIYAGTVDATGNSNGAGIGGGSERAGGSVAIYGGTVTATGGEGGGAGIGGGSKGAGGSVAIYGGTVTATGGYDEMLTGMGIGAGGTFEFDDPLDGGSLTLGTGVTMKVSSNNSTWTNYDGSTRARFMKTAAASHAHDFAYEKTAENVITATCSATDDCPLADNGYKATLTIGMPTTSDGKAVLTQDPADAFGDLSGEVQYQSKTGGSWDEATSTPRTSDGVHKASFTIDGKTISVTYGMNCISYATDIANGSIAGPSGATVGAAVMPTITPERGYELAALTVTPEEGSGVAAVALTEDGNGFIMPEANIAVSASFKKADYAIRTSAQHGTVIVKKGETAVTSANYQDNITLTITPDEGYELTTLTVVDAANAAVTVTDGAFVMPDAAISINATFTAVEYTVGVAQTSNGTLTASKATATIGNEIALTVTPADGYQLTSLTVTKENGGTVNVADGKFNMPADNVTISATFSAIVYTVTVSGAVATVTDNTPAQNTYTVTLNATDKDYDGEPTVATVTKSAGFPSAKVAIGSVTYKSSDGKTVAEAENSGSYTASVAVGDKVISKTFEIRRPEPIYYNFVVNQNGRSQKKVAVITQYILIKDNPNGIMILDDDKIYVAKGNVTIGALIIRGDVLVIPCEGSNLRVRAGIYHIGSSLSIYAEDGADDAVVDVTGEVAFSSLDANEKLEGLTVAGLGSTMSGDVRVYSGNLIMSKGVNANLVDDDFKFTVGVGVNPIVTTEAGSASLTGGTTSEEGFVSYASADFAGVLSLQTELNAVIGAAPTANTDLVYDGEPVELITEGEAIGGTMQYAFGNDANTVPAEGWSDSAPTATEAKTYYVWYMVKGDDNHKDSEAGCVTATVAISANQAAADAVIAVFDALPAQITLTDETAIAAARAAYDALTDDQKAKVPAEILAKLTAAEAALAAAMTTTVIEGIAADAVESKIWYDLNGRRLDGKPTKTGIYINNHKKVYVK